MAEQQVQIQKTIYNLRDFNSVVNTDFSELANPLSPKENDTTPEQNIQDLFELYNTLFYNIPPSGSENSHLELATRSLEYLGVSLDDLTTEISNLREENIELKNQILQTTELNIE